MIIAIVFGVSILTFGGTLAYLYSKDTPTPKTINAAEPLSHQQHEEIKVQLTKVLQEKDAKASLDLLRNAIKNDTSLARECHPLLHHLGHAAYKKYGGFEKSISYQDGLCNSGYTHGTIEAHFMASKDTQATLQTTCPGKDAKETFQVWQCYHGIGHGVMYHTNKDLAQSLSMCENLATDFAQNACANGAFMERFIVVSHTGASVKNASDVNAEICRQQSIKYKPECYMYSATAYLEQHTNDFIGAFDECMNVEKNYTATCVYGVGGQAMKENITHPEVSKNICQNAHNKYQNTCIAGAIGILINHNASTAPVEPLCDTTFAQYKTICNAKIRSWNALYN